MEVDKFEEFFNQFYQNELMVAASKGQTSIEIDFRLLDKFDPMLADKLLNDPDELLQQARDAISNVDLPEGSVIIEPRFNNLPEESTFRIRNIRSEHMGKFICLEGVVRRASEVKPHILYGIFECADCGNHMETLPVDKIVSPPFICDKCGRKGRFDLVDKKLFDARMVTVEEPFEITTGEKSAQMNVFLKNDLTAPGVQRKHDPGNRLKINGIVREIRRIIKGKMKTELGVLIDANHVETTEIEWEELNISDEDIDEIKRLAADPEIYNKIVGSIAPSIFGLDQVKVAVMFQLFGGVPRILADGIRIRGDIHVLLLGDPSTAKSQILKHVSHIMPRGKYVSGRGASAAGLTATVVKDEDMGGWVLEAGAMILTNKSLLAIDEFDKIGKDDQVAMHEAMSIQTVSIAKASIIATLPAQVSILAGANPKLSRFDKYKGIAQQIDIPDTLLSRFDLKFVLKDEPNKERDRKLAEHILETRLNAGKSEPILKPEFLRKYLAYARKYAQPEMTIEAARALTEFYIEMRSKSTADTIAITLRQNEALMRLSEASAKIRLSNRVEIQDAKRAIDVMEFSIRDLGYDVETGNIDIDRIEEKTSSTQRTKIHMLLDIIEMLEKKLGRPVPKDEVMAEAQEEGLSVKTAEEILDRLKKEGFTFEPKTGFVQRI